MRKMARQTKLLQFDQKTKLIIKNRDKDCIFCAQGYHMKCTNNLEYEIKDIMHYIAKSQMGLGIEQNGALGCRYHHHLLDNGNRGLHQEMQALFREYLKSKYPDWNEESLTYSKWNPLPSVVGERTSNANG